MKPFTKAKLDMWFGGLFTAFAVVPPYNTSSVLLALIAILWTVAANIDLNEHSK